MPGAVPGCPGTASVSALLAPSTLQPSQGISSMYGATNVDQHLPDPSPTFLSSPSEYATLSSVKKGRDHDPLSSVLGPKSISSKVFSLQLQILAICFLSLDALFLPLMSPLPYPILSAHLLLILAKFQRRKQLPPKPFPIPEPP